MKYVLWLSAIFSFIILKPTFFPFITGENFFFRTCIVVFSFLFAMSFVILKSFREEVTKKVKIVYKNPIFIASTIFVLFSIISTIFALNKFNAFWGTVERAEGLVGLVYIYSFFIFSLFIFNRKDWNTYFKIVISITSIILIRQFYQFVVGIYRPGSFLDNPTFLSGYLIFSIFSSIFILSEKRNNFWKYFSILIIFLSILGIFLTGTRGALLGVVLGFISLLILFIFKGKKNRIGKFNLRKISVVILVIFCLFSSVFILTRHSDIWKGIPGLQRVANIGSSDTTTQTRLITAEIGIKAMNPKEIGIRNLLFGFGFESYGSLYLKYFNTNQFDYEIRWFDRSHNKFVDVFVMCGLLGLITYLSLYYFLVRQVIKKKELSFENSAILFFTISIFVHLFFVFDHIGTIVALYSVMSLAIYLSDLENSNLKQIVNTRQDLVLYKVLPCVFISLSLFLIYIFIRNDLTSYLQMRNYKMIKANSDKAFVLDNIENVFYPFTPAQMNIREDFIDFVENYKDDSDFSKFSSLAISKAEEYSNRNIEDARFLVYLAKGYSSYGKDMRDSSLLKKGEDVFRKILIINSERPDVNYGLGLNLYYQQRYSESLIYFEKSFDNSHNFYDKNKKDAEIVYINLMKYFYRDSNKADFVKVLERLVYEGYSGGAPISKILEFVKRYNILPTINFQ